MKLTDKQKTVYVLAHTKGIGNIKGRKLLEALADITTIVKDLKACRNVILSVLSENDYTELCMAVSEIKFDMVEKALDAKSTVIVTIVDYNYPQKLLPYEDIPLILYCKGNIDLLNAPCFAVVGTRYPTRYGLRATEEFTEKLSERFCIVSGMARGVDGKAHRVALDSHGKTIAVLGCGTDIVYPAENYSLYKDIIEYGLIISEYDIGTKANACNFPARNRIISGISDGVLITEAGLKSGTMITLNYALEQGKDVYCIPGSIYSNQSSGCNRSIRDCQSRAVINVNDIYEEMGLTKVDVSKPSDLQLDINEEFIITELTQNGEMHFEELADKVNLTVSQLNSLLIKMEAVGLINKTKHNYWSV